MSYLSINVMEVLSEGRFFARVKLLKTHLSVSEQ
jgi:hypothetical protein